METEATMAESSTPVPDPIQEVVKPVHTILLDSSPLLLNTPSLSTLLAHSHVLVTTPSVLAEIRNDEARSRVDTLYRPFLTIQSPKPESVKFVKEFARKTGDAAVLSQVDFEVLALAYDLECLRNHGDWRLRRVPGQKRVNGSAPQREIAQGRVADTDTREDVSQEQESLGADEASGDDQPSSKLVQEEADGVPLETGEPNHPISDSSSAQPLPVEATETLAEPLSQQDNITSSSTIEEHTSDSDEGWITPSNIKRRQAEESSASTSTRKETKSLQVATMTGDFAMQNVLLQMNLNLLSTKTCKRISNIKQTIFRCHGCFATTKDMSKQFCPRCGKPTLTRVSCTTNDKGEVKLHLKANMQWNNKGNVFSIPKPISGSANQKWKGAKHGGGQAGWGTDLILAEDQKEYVRALSTNQRMKSKDLMDQDTLPSILSGERDRGGGRVRVGAGRNVNSRRK